MPSPTLTQLRLYIPKVGFHKTYPIIILFVFSPLSPPLLWSSTTWSFCSFVQVMCQITRVAWIVLLYILMTNPFYWRDAT
ncbi:hypothetical protein RDI58_024963 [Solanum bulbocastanum]|uniref:Uncharacterized protein n=1 Tax=Solanum bulbocastanum TaxID=147425 RepID=A0AAN8T0Q5_SOLBU